MKKILFIALALVTSAFFTTAVAGDKNKKKQKQQDKVVVLKNASDTVSYAAGKTIAQNMLRNSKDQNMLPEKQYMDDFARGYYEAVAQLNDPQFQAYLSGLQAAQTAQERVLPSLKSNFEGTPDSITNELFHAGFIDGLQHDDNVLIDGQAEMIFEDRLRQDRPAAQAFFKEKNEAWLKANATKEGVKTTASGLQYKVLREGTGETPKANDQVVVKYEGKTIDGKVFDSSYRRNPQTSKFRCDQVIKGWTEALTMMKTGSMWEIYIPQQLAYGEKGAGNVIRPYSTLIFVIELDKIAKDSHKK